MFCYIVSVGDEEGRERGGSVGKKREGRFTSNFVVAAQ